MVKPILLLSLLSIAQQVSCWGSLGHRTVAYLGQKYLTSEASTYVKNLLGDEDISDAALWPDEIRRTHDWAYTSEWHYIDAKDDPPHSCGVNYKRDCVDSAGCIVSAIVNMTARINDPNLSADQQYYALKFLIHFIGDIHQPLHTESENRGGNGIPVLFNKKHTNLHSVWDNEVLEKHAGGAKADEKADAQKWASDLFGAAGMRGAHCLSECHSLQDAETCALEWAGEANAKVCSYVLKDDVAGVEGKNLAEDYYTGAVPIVDELVGKAALRLGGWLNALAVANRTEGPKVEEELVKQAGEEFVHGMFVQGV